MALEALSGASGAPSGRVALAGAVATPAQRRFAAAFAPQDDILPPHLTVAEHLRFHARLRLPARWPKKRAAARALREAEALGLTGAALHATRLWRCSVEPFTDADRDRLSSRAQGIDEAVTEVPQVPQTPFGLYHNPDDVRICVCYVLGLIAFAFSMAVHCTTSDCARGGDRSTPTG